MAVRVGFDASSMRGRATGIGVYTRNLINALREFEPGIAVVELDDGTTVDQRTDKRILREQIGLPRLARAANLHLLHLTGFAAPLRPPCPVVLTVMDLIGVLFSRNFPPASRFYWSRYLPMTLSSAQHLVTLSAHTRQDVIRLARVSSNRITVIEPGIEARFRVIDDHATLDAVRRELQLPDRFFLFVSTLEPRKGIGTLIAAYSQIAAQVHEDLVIVGKRGWYWTQLMRQAEATGLARRIRFLDYVTDEQLPCVYNLARAFIFPSRYEGFGLTPLEAMASGTPVVCSNASSLPEVVGDAGILLPPHDTAGFSQAMLDLSRDDSFALSLQAEGLKRSSQFSWKRAAQGMRVIYESLLPGL